MTVRTTKRLILVLVGLLGLLTIVEVALMVLRPSGVHDYVRLVLPLSAMVISINSWRQLSKLEAEHGPDYAPAITPTERKILIGVALLAAIGGGVLVYLIATR